MHSQFIIVRFGRSLPLLELIQVGLKCILQHFTSLIQGKGSPLVSFQLPTICFLLHPPRWGQTQAQPELFPQCFGLPPPLFARHPPP